MAKRPGLRMYGVAIFILAAASCLTALGNGFALDDVPIIQNNPAVHAFDMEEIWTGPYWPNGAGLGLYRPLTTTLFAAQWAVGDGSPLTYHIVSLLLHGAVSVLALLLLVRLLPRTTHALHAAVAGAAIFAVHPVHVEAVANAVGQSELLAALAVLGACVVWTRRSPDAAPTWRDVLTVSALYMLGMMSKEHVIVLPALLLAVDAATGRG